MLDRSELHRLAALAREGDVAARDRIVEQNRGLVGGAIERLRRSGVRCRPGTAERADMEQAGLVGLVNAAARWDPGVGCCFSTFAVRAILHELFGEVRRSHAVVVPDVTARHARRWRKLAAAEPGLPGREIARRLGITEQRAECVRDALAVAGRHTVPAEPWWVASEDHSADRVDRRDQADRVRAAMAGLDPRSRAVLEKRYGLDGGPGMTLVQVGFEMGFSHERARQLIVAAERRLRAILGV